MEKLFLCLVKDNPTYYLVDNENFYITPAESVTEATYPTAMLWESTKIGFPELFRPFWPSAL